MMGVQRFNKRHNWASHIFRSGSRLAGLTTDFEIDRPSWVECRGWVNFQHRGGQAGILADLPVGVSLYLGYRRADTLAQLPACPTGARTAPLFNELFDGRRMVWFHGAKDGGNIRDLRQHYLTLNLGAAQELPAGAYRIEAWAFAHTAIQPFDSRDDIVCVNTDTNQIEDDTFGHLATTVTPL